MTALKAGHLVYRVVEEDLPNDDSLHTWKVACVIVDQASARQIRLKKRFPGVGRVLFSPDALGRSFFESPLQAINFFVTSKQLEIESFERRRKEAERSIAWATSQPGMKDSP